MECTNMLRRFLCSAILLCGGLTLCGQAREGEVRVQVKDPSGTAMEASGKLVTLATGVERRFQTDSLGTFILSGLPFGRYRLELSKAGFATQSVVIEVQSATPLSRTITMALVAQSSKVDVVANTPLRGMDLPINEIPAPVQTATQADIQNSSALDLADFMNRRLNGVYINEMQDNPFQPDVNYRGYTASPLLGTPEGISVYVDGVRQNQPFGDVVSWDLIQRNTVSEMTLMPGSNPVFGLNTLGGSISVTTRDGVSYPGLSGQVLYGSSGRKSVEGAYGGGHATGFNWYLAGNGFHESGWRFDSPSDVKQGFAKLGWRTAKTDIALTMAFAYNTLTGNGIQDYRLLQSDYSSVYSIPDMTGNRSPSFNFIARHSFNDALTFSGNAWLRYIRTEAINGNANNDAFGGPVYRLTRADQAALTAAGYTGFPTGAENGSNTPYPSLTCIANALRLADPDETCDAVNVYSREAQYDYGVSGQLTWVTKPGGHRNQLTAGAVLDRGTVSYTQNTQYGYLLPDAAIVGVPAWQDGSTSVDGSPVDSRVNLRGVTPNGSFFAIDTFSFAQNWNLTVAGRYNRTVIHNTDLLTPIGPGSLDGDYVYGRLNPSVGITYNPMLALNVYANYSQSSRAPTSIELGCADPNNPCSLPNALSSDPPLSQVVTATWEAGLRGKLEQFHTNWDLGAFRAENRNDILFVAAPETGTGYFQNFARTQREGVQASVDSHFHRVTVGLDYTFLSATYQSVETLDGTGNNTSDIALSGYPGVGGVITVHPGNRIPLIPKQSGKAFLDFQATKKFGIDLGLVANSSAYARGNENNAYKADGIYYLGPGVSPGYAIVNFAAHYDLTRHLQLGVQVDNLFDHHYYTAAQIENTPFTNSGTLTFQPFPAYASGLQAGNFPLQSATFFAPGAPRRAWVDLKLRF
jgi:outer membrane receptor protein involved in Fe transport